MFSTSQPSSFLWGEDNKRLSEGFALSKYYYEDMMGLEAWICLVKIWLGWHAGLEACIICLVRIWLWGHDGVRSLYYLPCQNMIMRTWRGWKPKFALSKYVYKEMTGLEAWMICLVKIWLIGHDVVESLNDLPCQTMIMRTWRDWKPEFALSKYDYEDMTGLEAWIFLSKYD